MQLLAVESPLMWSGLGAEVVRHAPREATINATSATPGYSLAPRRGGQGTSPAWMALMTTEDVPISPETLRLALQAWPEVTEFVAPIDAN